MADESVVRPWADTAAPPTRWTLTVAEREAALPPTPYECLDDPALVEACRAGHPEAFDVIISRHRRSVYQVCYRFAGNHEDASDLTQETFVRVWRGLGGFKGQAAFSTWIYRIAVNACLNRAPRQSMTEPLDGNDFVDARAVDPRAGLIHDERAQRVREAIARLPAKQRATLILRAYQELSHKEIAGILGSSVGAVKANFFHALANLRKILGSEP